MIFQTVKTIHFKAPQATIALQTNATLLDVVLVRFLKKHKVQVGISIDGPPTVHEKTRGKFREMFEGLECLESCNVPWRATVVVTAETIEHLWSLALLISRFKTARGIALDFLTRKGLAVKNSIEPATPEIVKHGVIKLLETLEMINRSSRPPIRFREADAVANSKHRHAIRAFCHACSGESLAVYPDGSVYPCSQLCGEDRYYAGNVYGSIDWPRLRLQSSALQCDDCCSCDLHGFCPGDCPSRLAYNTKGEQCAVCALYQTIYAFQKKEQVV
jgi:uncharacterized protein